MRTAGKADFKFQPITPKTYGGRIFNVLSDKQEFSESKENVKTNRVQEIHLDYRAPIAIEMKTPANFPTNGAETEVVIPVNYEGRGILRLAQVFLSRNTNIDFLVPSRKSAEVRLTFPSCKAPSSINYLTTIAGDNFDPTQAVNIAPYITLVPPLNVGAPTNTYKDVYEGEFNGDTKAITVTQNGSPAIVRGIAMRIRVYPAIFGGVTDRTFETLVMTLKFEFTPTDEKIIR